MLLGIVPFGIITGVAMVASGIPPLVATLMSVVVFAGASMVASAQLLSSHAPALLIHLCRRRGTAIWAPEVPVQK